MATHQHGAAHPNISLGASTILTQAVSSSATAITVQSTGYGSTRSKGNVFADNDFLLIGNFGEETAEIVQVGAVVASTTSLTTDALQFSHPEGTPVTVIDYDQVELHRSTTGIAGAYTLVGSAIGISVDQPFTVLEDTSSASDYYYKHRFKNTQTTTYSSFSPAVAPESTAIGTRYWLREQIRFLTKMRDEQEISDSELNTLIEKAHSDILRKKPLWWFLEATPYSITTVSGQNFYRLPSDFRTIKYVQFYNNDIDEYTTLNAIRFEDFLDETKDDDRPLSDYVTHYCTDQSNLYIDPTPETAGHTIELYYYKKFDALSTDTSVTACPDPWLIVNLVGIEIASHINEGLNVQKFLADATEGMLALMNGGDYDAKRNKGMFIPGRHSQRGYRKNRRRVITGDT